MPAKKYSTSTTMYVFGIIAILILVYLVFNLKQKNDILQSAVTQLSEENNKISENLAVAEETIVSQKKTIDSLNSNVHNLNNQLKEVTTKIDDTRISLNDFETQVQDSASWFKENSNIKNFSEYKSLASQLTKCFRVTETTCNIKLSCLDLIHEKYREFKFAYDNVTTNKTDKLQSLVEFYRNGEGDCEDFSLLMKAEINDIKSDCITNGADRFQIEVAIPSPGNSYFVDFKEQWFYNDVSGFAIPESFQNIYIVCGYYPGSSDPNRISSQDAVGHCALGFTDKKIESSSDVSSALTNSIIMEPQTGFLTFDQRENNVLFVPRNGGSVVGKRYYVWAVISDDDYYLFDFSKLTWQGYKDFLPIIQNLRSDLENINVQK